MPCTALPSWQGRRLGRRPQQQLTCGLRLRSLYAPFAKPSVRSQRLPEEEAQPLRPRSGFANRQPLAEIAHPTPEKP